MKAGNLKTFGVYLLAYCVIILAVAVLTPYWKDMDWLFFRLVTKSDQQKLSDDIVIIDLPYSPNDIADFRRRLGLLLTDISRTQERPKAIGIDVYIDREDHGIAPLVDGIRDVTTAKIPVYGVVKITGENNGNDPNYMEKHSRVSIEELTCCGHTVVNSKFGTLFFRHTWWR